MKSSVLILCLLVLMLSACNNASIKQSNKTESQNIPDYKSKLLKKLDLGKDIDKILFVPDNSCKGCLKRTIDLCDKLSSNKNLKIYYINELGLIKNECAKKHDSINFDIDYSNYDIYGITLFDLDKDSVNITYVDANNIDSVYFRLLK